jgi:pimeloyl-ACP methyl ester carboxylesterase
MTSRSTRRGGRGGTSRDALCPKSRRPFCAKCAGPVGLAVLALLAVGCSAPYGVRRVSPEAVHRSLTENVLSTGELSSFSRIALHRRNLTESFENDPAATLQGLHAELRAGRLAHEDLFSLAELSFHCASDEGGREHFLAAAVYGYAFLFPDDPRQESVRFDPRQRVAMDLYNRAITEAFESADGEHVEVAGGTRRLPFGEIEISFDPRQLIWSSRRLVDFTPAAELELLGFENRYRQPGLGAPLAAAMQPLDANAPPDFVGPRVRLPVTMLLRVPEPRRQILGARLEGVLELVSEGQTVEIDGQRVPLEQEPTAALALTLDVARPWTQDINVFLGKVLMAEAGPTFGGREPHRRGRIPVVFVHGTASNFSVWVNMLNDLESDPLVRDNFQFWFFRYDSGQPILYSAMLLRRALREAAQAFQAPGADPCADRMVVIGHSQGGLLVKLTGIESGDRFWRNVSDEPFEEARLGDRSRALLREALFVEPLPFVDRLIFIATPHRGSYLAGPDIVRRLAQRLITMPASVARLSADLLADESIRRRTGLQRVPTSIDNMSPRHPFIVASAAIPVSPRIKAHSIIGVTGDGPREKGGDGVVKYASAHIDGVESELVVPYEHSMQAKPEVVAEVQRILHRHLELNPCSIDR